MRGDDLAVEKESRRWWHLPNLLGLDAPLIAVMWLFLFARTWRILYHPWEAYFALALAVWTIRIAGLLLESAMTNDSSRFSPWQRIWLKRCAFLTGLAAVLLTVLNFPLSVYNFLLVGGLMVAGYFAVSLFSGQEEEEISYSKHVLGGLAFAFGIGLTAQVYLPNTGIKDLFFSKEFICFSVLCFLTSSAVDIWGKAERSEDQEITTLEEISLSLPLTLLGAASLVYAVQDEAMLSRPFYYAVLTGAALLQVLNRARGRFDIVTLKTLAVLSLLIPGLVFLSYPMER
ncbi:MAG: hypothetical protein ACSHX9_13330 [Luteolibacter sp.]